MEQKAESVAKKADAHSIVFEGKVEICDDYAGKEEILARIHEAFHAGVEAIAGAEARRAVETEGLRSLHKHLRPSKVSLLEAFVNKRIRDDLYYWAYRVGRETIGLADPFYIDLLIVLRIHYPHVVARDGGPAERAPYDWRDRGRMVLAGLRNPAIFVNQITRRIRKRTKIREHRIAYDETSFHGDLPTLARAHAAHIDTWYGHSYDGFNVWLSIDGVNRDNTVILYPELFGHKVDFDPKSMYLQPGIPIPKPTKVELKPGQLLLFNPEMLHGTQVNISDDTRVALTIRINPGVPRFNDDAPFNAEHWYASTDVAQRRFTKMSLFPANRFQGEPTVGAAPIVSDPRTHLAVISDAGAPGEDVVLARSSDLKTGEKLGIDAPGMKLLLVRTAQGVRAYDRRCPHRAVDLIDGAHDESQIFCPGHGIAFGLVDGHSSCAAFKLRSFDVVEGDGKIVLRRKLATQKAATAPVAAA
ncbi:MAG: Rieske 2Fe-2S domain-containing protein [Sphingomonadales bacterium]|nr:Rieske 2Fe-2S domain-containing protein [Sphingomonadales bacterium]